MKQVGERRRLGDEALRLIARATIQGNRLIMPNIGREVREADPSLSRAKAEAARALVDSGGTASNRGHVFPPGRAHAVQDAIAVVETAVEDVRVAQLADLVDTPRPTAETLVAGARVHEGHAVLEPSAGVGVLADALRRIAGVAPDCCELSSRGRAALLAKGHAVAGADFQTYRSNRHFDRVVMAPPVSGGQAIAHTLRAFHLLKPGGELVAALPRYVLWHPSEPAELLRTVIQELGGVTPLNDGTYAVAATGDAVPYVVATVVRGTVPHEPAE
jgi:hypothetical protein